MAITISEIAARANVSLTTVSLVLNGKGNISDETRERVKKAMLELGYVPKKSAGKKTNKGILFVNYIKHGNVVSKTPFFNSLTEHLEEAVHHSGYLLSILQVRSFNEFSSFIAENGASSNIVGIILLATEMSNSEIARFLHSSLPIVILDNYAFGLDVDSVSINNVEGVYKAIRHLQSSGYSCIGQLKSSIYISNFDERNTGFINACKQMNLKCCRSIELSPSIQGAYNDMLLYLKSNHSLDTPCAFFADNDLIAIGACKALKEAGYSLPADISIIGFDDIPACSVVEPELTTLNVDNELYSRTVVSALERKIGSSGAYNCVKSQISTQLMERGSVKKI